jgi:hypothetical protein
MSGTRLVKRQAMNRRYNLHETIVTLLTVGIRLKLYIVSIEFPLHHPQCYSNTGLIALIGVPTQVRADSGIAAPLRDGLVIANCDSSFP